MIPSIRKCPTRDRELADALQLLHDVLDPTLVDSLQPSAPQTIYTTWVTIWMILYQRIHNNATLASAVDAFCNILAPFSTNKRIVDQTLSSNTAGFSRARSRLDVEVANTAADHVFASLLPATPNSPLTGRRVFIHDGTTLSLSSVAELRKQWPGITNQHGDSPWPIAQVVVLHDLETGLAMRPEVGAMYGPAAESEVAMAIKMLPRIPANSVLLADRGFGIFGYVHAVVQAGHDAIARLTEPRFRSMVRQARWLRPGVWELSWCPSKKDRTTFADLPEGAMVAVHLYEFIGQEGKPMWVCSTIRNLTVEAVSALYLRRGEVELDIRQWKVQMQMSSLRGRSVSMVLKELALGSIAYNLVVRVRYVASVRGKVEAKRLSFSGVWSLVKEMLLSGMDRSASEWLHDFDWVLDRCLQRKIPNRPGRSYRREAYSKRGSKFPARGSPPKESKPK